MLELNIAKHINHWCFNISVCNNQAVTSCQFMIWQEEIYKHTAESLARVLSLGCLSPSVTMQCEVFFRLRKID